MVDPAQVTNCPHLLNHYILLKVFHTVALASNVSHTLIAAVLNFKIVFICEDVVFGLVFSCRVL